MYDILVGADMGGGGGGGRRTEEDPTLPDFRLAVGSVSEPEPAYNTQQVRTSFLFFAITSICLGFAKIVVCIISSSNWENEKSNEDRRHVESGPFLLPFHTFFRFFFLLNF